ncbi:MAG: hypothetical protein JWL77_307 [Chthonomonadaceae bacterium]|nr:hypothetical protein [Chthonomonadaceae bacterium]
MHPQLGDLLLFHNARNKPPDHYLFNYTSPGKYSCGEFVETAFEKAGVRLLPDHDPDDVVPGDYARYVPPAERRQVR